MSCTVRYEIEVEIPGEGVLFKDEEQVLATALQQGNGFTFNPGPGNVTVWSDGRSFIAFGEESDWSRSHEQRDAEVRGAIPVNLRDVVPAGTKIKIITRWYLVDDCEPWDDTFGEDEDEDDEDEPDSGNGVYNEGAPDDDAG